MKHRRLQVRDLMTKDPITIGGGLLLYDAYPLCLRTKSAASP